MPAARFRPGAICGLVLLTLGLGGAWVSQLAALEAVPGVLAVEVNFEDRSARVRYDPDRATPEQLQQATANAGYPAQPVLANRTGESP